MFELTPGPEEKKKRRERRRDPVPRFKTDKAAQLGEVAGCPEWQVPEGHLTRHVREWVEKLDTGHLEEAVREARRVLVGAGLPEDTPPAGGRGRGLLVLG
ncbi:hypothetical protein [Cystobacter fuscus]|uniref:hypothetical protein n=1 Tax=Cystobacter fuscus TaxID=43 RepID=UPI002B2BBC0E|nr:hypothetical protein F0U63_16060 [Cystobacter fuscus]